MPKQPSTCKDAAMSTQQLLDAETVVIAADALATLASARPAQVAMATIEQHSWVLMIMAHGWVQPALSRCGICIVAAAMRTSFGRASFYKLRPCFSTKPCERSSSRMTCANAAMFVGNSVASKGCQLVAAFSLSGISEKWKGSMTSLSWSSTLYAAIIALWGFVGALVRHCDTLTIKLPWEALDNCLKISLLVIEASVTNNSSDYAIHAAPAAVMLLDRLALLPDLAFHEDGDCLFRVLAILCAQTLDKKTVDAPNPVALAAVASRDAMICEVRRGAALVLARLGGSILGVCAATMATARTQRRWKTYSVCVHAYRVDVKGLLSRFCGVIISSRDSFATVSFCYPVLCKETIL